MTWKDETYSQLSTVLITNDDGIHAPGIFSLAELLSTCFDQVYVVAPSDDVSGSSSSFTAQQIVKAWKVDRWSEKENIQAWVVSGTPADCIFIGWHHLCPQRPSLVCSGVNAGFNIGLNFFTSGTVGGVIAGVSLGSPAIAFSIGQMQDLTPVNPYILSIVSLAQRDPVPGGWFNVNMPKDISSIKGARITKQSSCIWAPVPTEWVHPDSQRSFHWALGEVGHADTDPHSLHELCVVEAGYISVTPTSMDFLPNLDYVKENQNVLLDYSDAIIMQNHKN